MKISELEHDAIIWSEQFKSYNRDKSYIIFESASSCIFNGTERFSGSFIAHIYRKGDFRFDCGVNTYGEYEVVTKKIK